MYCFQFFHQMKHYIWLHLWIVILFTRYTSCNFFDVCQFQFTNFLPSVKLTTNVIIINSNIEEFSSLRIAVTSFGYRNVAVRTSYFCLARKLIWPLWSSHIFTQWGWLILFCPDHFPGQHKNGESPPNLLFIRIFRAGRTYFLSSLFIAAEPLH